MWQNGGKRAYDLHSAALYRSVRSSLFAPTPASINDSRILQSEPDNGPIFRSPPSRTGYGFLLRADRSEQSFIDGAENGFGIDGMYVNDGATRPSMAILAGEDMEWQICNDDGSCLSGRLAATSDPNSFDLLDDDGADCGSVHLSYASRDGMDGILYVSHETGDFKMHRTNWVPAFIEE